MSSSGTESITRSRELLRTSKDLIDDMGWEGLGQSILGTMALTFVLGMADLFNAILGVPMAILNTISSLIPALNEATFGGIAGFVAAGFEAGGNAFGTGWTALLGILQAPLGIGVGLFMLWEVAWYLDYVDRDFIGWAMDVPDFLSNADDSGVADGAEDE